jgi:hypothetical protein
MERENGGGAQPSQSNLMQGDISAYELPSHAQQEVALPDLNMHRSRNERRSHQQTMRTHVIKGTKHVIDKFFPAKSY